MRLLTILFLLGCSMHSLAQTADTIPPSFTHGSISEPQGLNAEPSYDNDIYFPINNGIYYTELSQFKNKEAKQTFIRVLDLADYKLSIDKRTEEIRTQYNNARSLDAKKIYGDSITELEQKSFTLLKDINTTKQKAYDLEKTYWQTASPTEIEDFIAQNEEKKEHIASIEELENADIQLQIEPTNTKQNKDNAMEGIVYKVQVGRYKTTPWSVQQKFKKLSVIRKIDQETNDEGQTLYTIGTLDSYHAAEQMQTQLETEGFTKTKIIAFENDVEIEIDEAGNKVVKEETEAPAN